MPVVELNINRIRKLVSGNVTRKQILDVLPFLGLDIESEVGDEIRIEYSPNRPDYSTEFGVALGLQGLLGIKKGSSKEEIMKAANSLQKKIHPDVNPNSNTERLSQIVNEAKETALKDFT